jgi:hypothetical protein
LPDQYFAQLRVHAPVPLFVSICQSAAAGLVHETPCGTSDLGERRDNRRYRAGFSKGKLSIGHAQKLVPTGKAPEPLFGMKAIDTAMKLLWVNKIY